MRQDARNVGTQVRRHRTQGTQKIRRLRQDATPTDQTQDPFLLMNRERNKMRNGRGSPIAEVMAEKEIIPGNTGLMKNESLKERKRTNIKVDAPGSAIDTLAKIIPCVLCVLCV